MATMKEQVRLSIFIDKKLREAFKAHAAIMGTSMTEKITEFIKSEIKKTGK